MRYLTYFLSLTLFVTLGALIGAPSANAASIYDNAYIKTDDLTLTTANCSLDATYLYDEAIVDPDAWPDQYWYVYGAEQYDAKSAYAVTKVSSDSIRVISTIQSNSYFIWNTDAVNASGGHQLYNLYLDDQSCTLKVSFGGDNASPYLSKIWGTPAYNFFAFGYDYNYPPDYAGTPVVTDPPDPVQTIENSPAWYISNIISNVGTFHDKNFNTFDDNPFLCEGGLAPILYYEIFRILPDDSEVLLTSGFQSATAQITYDFKEGDSDRDYLLLGWYDCGDGTIFPNQGRLVFTINRAGLQKIDLFENCLLPIFPWVNADGCLANLYTVINLFYFGKVTLPTFSFDTTCRNLYLMDDWLGLPSGYQVCPQIPSTVRSITTPFVAFMLGLVTLGFIKRIRTEFDG